MSNSASAVRKIGRDSEISAVAREKAIAHFGPRLEGARTLGVIDDRAIDGRVGIDRRPRGVFHVPVDQQRGIVGGRHVRAIRQGLQLGGALGVQVKIEAVGHGRRIPLRANDVKSYRFSSAGSPPWAVMLTLTARSTA